MTADERIESLLNCFGQTIADLPKPTEVSYAYTEEHRDSAAQIALAWNRVYAFTSTFLKDYICHLTDVIDRMETALNTAKMVASCAYCRNEDGNNCEGCIGENFEIDDSVFIEEDDEFTEEGD